MTSTITARRLLRGNEIVEYPRITVDDGHITSILSHESALQPPRVAIPFIPFPKPCWCRLISTFMSTAPRATT
jgi:hypothetical protein